MAFNYEVGATGSILWAGGMPPRVIQGTVAGVDGENLRFDIGVESAREVGQGERVVLTLEGQTAVRVRARVLAVDGGVLRLETSPYQHMSRREYPRIDAPVSLQWRLKEGGGKGLSPGVLKVMSQWSSPLDSEVNLSVAGLAFPTLYDVPEGARLELKITLPGGPVPAYGVEAEVVRTTPTDDPRPGHREDGETVHRVAVHFIDLSDSLRDVFVEYTLKQQDAYLGLSASPEEEV